MPDTLNNAHLEPLAAGGLPPSWNDDIASSALAGAIDQALAAVDRNLAHFGDDFPAPSSVGSVYPTIGNIEWTNGFWTGMLWLAYELTGAARYRSAAEAHVRSFDARQK